MQWLQFVLLEMNWLNFCFPLIQNKSIEVHIGLLKKKVQTEIEQTKKSDDKQVSHIHQQINEKRNEINRIDHQLNKIIQENS